MAIVYRHRRLDSFEIFYIGIGKELKRAYNRETSKRNKLWSKIVNKHGYLVEILFKDITWEEACEIEKILILEYGRIDLGTGKLCNMTDGGEGAIGLLKTEEHRKKIGISNKGKKRDDEAKQKMREARKNYIISDETRFKLSIAGKERKVSKETRNKQSVSNKGKNLGAKSARAKLILDTQTGVFYYCIREASDAYSMDIDFLQRRLSNKCKNSTNLIYV